MACRICKRGACTESFHSFSEQNKLAERENMSDDIDTLRCEIQDLKEELAEAKREIKRLENENSDIITANCPL